MATFVPGYLFGATEQVTPTKLNNLVDLATLTGLSATNFAGGTAQVIFYGNTAPPISRGKLWYDTTVGSEGLKYAFVSASAGSVTRFLYATPRRDMMCWAASAASLGQPLYIGNPSVIFLNGSDWTVFDGTFFPTVYNSTTTLAHLLTVIANESAGANQPISCAFAGLCRPAGYNFATSPINRGAVLNMNKAASHQLRAVSTIKAFATEQGLGLAMDTDVSADPAVAVLLTGPTYDKNV